MKRSIERRARLAQAAAIGLLIGASSAACEQPAKSAADAKDGGSGNETLDRSGAADKAHCGGKGE